MKGKASKTVDRKDVEAQSLAGEYSNSIEQILNLY